MQRLNLFKPLSFISRPAFRPKVCSPMTTMTAPSSMSFTASPVVRQHDRESLREREDRRRELSKLMERWQCTIGFEFHVQMNTKYKMFSSK